MLWQVTMDNSLKQPALLGDDRNADLPTAFLLEAPQMEEIGASLP